ncbi:MAG: transcriptional regulator, Fur family transcriptional regulator, ferric uptake regulator [Patescibacteria group bacterium]|nr:transcriptional regulator, Fur family transcriptional regulator, ferric uptake regulator [Patescibacteria group bacterium]
MILQMIDKFKQHLKHAGQKVTQPRLAAFAFLQEHDPTTAAAMIEYLAPAIDRASVYRALALFRNLDIVHDIVAGGHRMIELTDSFDSHHHHLSCTRCGQHESIEDDEIERQLSAVARARGFAPTSHQIQISGLCRMCRQA